jgi:hypothetical protein
VEDLVVVELKSTEHFVVADHRQGTNYLKYSTFEVGLLFAFGGPKLKINRKDFSYELKQRILAGEAGESLWMLLQGRDLPGTSRKTA